MDEDIPTLDYEAIDRRSIAGFIHFGERILVLAGYDEGVLVEKSALVPEGYRNPRWDGTWFNQEFHRIDVPAYPEPFSFGWHDAMMAADEGYVAWRLARDAERSPAWGAMMREQRLKRRLTVGQLARLSGVSARTIRLIEAGHPVYPIKLKIWCLTALARVARGLKPGRHATLEA